MRSFQNDFKRDRLHLRRSSQHPIVMVIDNTIARGESVDGRIGVPRNNFTGLGQRGAQEVFCQGVTTDKAINAFTGVIGMKLNNAAEMARAQLLLQYRDFRLDRPAPELPVQIAATARTARVVRSEE